MRRAAREVGRRAGGLVWPRGVATTAAAESAAPAVAAAASKGPSPQNFLVYKWNPEAPGEKPHYKSYKASRGRRGQRERARRALPRVCCPRGVSGLAWALPRPPHASSG